MQSAESQNNSSDKWFSLNNKRTQRLFQMQKAISTETGGCGGLQCEILFLERCWISGLQMSQ